MVSLSVFSRVFCIIYTTCKADNYYLNRVRLLGNGKIAFLFFFFLSEWGNTLH